MERVDVQVNLLHPGTTRPDKHGRGILYLVKCDLSSVRYSTRVHWTRYQKHTAMYNWLPCNNKVEEHPRSNSLEAREDLLL